MYSNYILLYILQNGEAVVQYLIGGENMAELFEVLMVVVSAKINYVIAFYIINFVMVSIDLFLYFRNSEIDKKHVHFYLQ